MRLRRIEVGARVRLVIGSIVVALGAAVAFGPAPIAALLVVGLGLLLIGLVSTAFDLVLLRRVGRAIAAARYEESFGPLR